MEVSGRGRRLQRHVGLNRLQDVALCWWNLDETDDELWPWTPTNMQRNNLVLISCSPTEGLKVQTLIYNTYTLVRHNIKTTMFFWETLVLVFMWMVYLDLYGYF